MYTQFTILLLEIFISITDANFEKQNKSNKTKTNFKKNPRDFFQPKAPTNSQKAHITLLR